MEFVLGFLIGLIFGIVIAYGICTVCRKLTDKIAKWIERKLK